MIRTLSALVLTATPLCAEPVQRADYALLAQILAGVQDFETFEPRPEPGINIDGPVTGEGVALGEHFHGQQMLAQWMNGGRHDIIAALPPTAPLTLQNGPPGQNLSVAYHPGFGSVALFPLGPDGFPDASARGEGALALWFADDVQAIGLKIHSDYPDPLGTRPAPGLAKLTFFSRAGQLVATHDITLEVGINEIGFRADGDGFAGLSITNSDPGGIAIDDILFPLTGLTS